jgi:hypothetical protein
MAVVVPVAPIRIFAIFMGFMVLADYALCVVMTFPAMCLQHRWLTRARSKGNGCALALLDIYSCCGCCSKGGSDSHSGGEPEKDALDRVLGGPVHSVVHKGRFILVALFAAAIGVCAWKSSNIPNPKSSDVQLLPDSHVITRFANWRLDLMTNSQSDSTTQVVWGLEPGDTGDQSNPESETKLLADRSFDPSSEAAQQWLLDFCNRTHHASVTKDDTPSSIRCPLQRMHEWLAAQATAGLPRCGGYAGLPVPAGMFHPCVAEFLSLSHYDEKWRLRMSGSRLVAMVAGFKSEIRWDSSYEALSQASNDWEHWMQQENSAAPSGVNRAFYTSYDFHCVCRTRTWSCI